ncbi:MAG: XRE family transcriptional regulator [Spirochaetota bacterium]|nr:XRE family transcriptional regulator [Spirochaetota bacterium]
MLNLADELKIIRKKLGKTQKEIAEEYGIPQTTWASYEVGKASPPMKILFSLAEKGYPIKGLASGLFESMVEDGKISKAELQKRLEIARAMAENTPPDTPIDDDWGKKVDAEYTAFHSGSTPVYTYADLVNNGKTFVVPLLGQKLSAGNGQELQQNDETTALIPVPSHLAKYRKNLAALIVDGDSMYPTLCRGDLVVCDSCGWSGEGIYALRMSGSGFVKRLTKAPGKLVVISDNPKYPVREEPEESQDIEIIGRVHCALKNME